MLQKTSGKAEVIATEMAKMGAGHNMSAGECENLGSCSHWWCTSWANLHCCDCGGGHTKLDLKAQADQDLLTVMTYNTYLLRVRIIFAIDTRPNLDVRALEISKWFKALKPEEVPDVLVFEEIYSDEGQDLLRYLCHPEWTKNSRVFGGRAHHEYLPCTVADSPFGYATGAANPTSSLNPVKTSGVVVLVKKGIALLAADDTPYNDCSGEECFTKLGWWAVQLQKGTQKYWAFGTHAIAYEDPTFIEIRQKQFKQMRDYINLHVEDGARLVIAGDMNIFTGPYKDSKMVDHIPNEEGPMLATLGASSAPATIGDHVPKGFWLPLAEPMAASADPVWNHVISAIPAESRLGHQRFDSVIAPGPGDRLTGPKYMRWQIVPVKSDTCFVSEQDGYPDGTTSDDLSDHYAVFAELRYADSAPSCPTVAGHKGSAGRLPAGPNCA